MHLMCMISGIEDRYRQKWSDYVVQAQSSHATIHPLMKSVSAAILFSYIMINVSLEKLVS